MGEGAWGCEGVCRCMCVSLGVGTYKWLSACMRVRAHTAWATRMS